MSNGVLFLKRLPEAPPPYDARALLVSPEHLQSIAELLADAVEPYGDSRMRALWEGGELVSVELPICSVGRKRIPAGSCVVLVNGERSFRAYKDLSSVPSEWGVIQ